MLAQVALLVHQGRADEIIGIDVRPPQHICLVVDYVVCSKTLPLQTTFCVPGTASRRALPVFLMYRPVLTKRGHHWILMRRTLCRLG